MTATIIPQGQHPVTTDLISDNALSVLSGLKDAGFEAYLVGGCIRDIFLDTEPKDFDLVTNALPEDIRKLFRNCRLIGRRFRLAHIYFGRETIEVATFRGPPDTKAQEVRHNPETGMIVRDNQYGTLADDIWRRDFTVNALYYNHADGSLVDYCDGISDLKKRKLKIIGSAEQRYREDPVRMLRAIRHACKLNLDFDPETAAPIKDLAHLLTNVSNARLFEEVLKLLIKGQAERTYLALEEFDLLPYLLPLTAEACVDSEQTEHLIQLALINTDKRIQEGKPINPAFLFAVFLWKPYQEALQRQLAQGLDKQDARHEAFSQIHKEQTLSVSIPRRLIEVIRQMWDMQDRLSKPRSKQIYRLLEHKRFRAAYDFLVLRAQSGETTLKKPADWWTKFQEENDSGRKRLMKQLGGRRQRPNEQKP